MEQNGTFSTTQHLLPHTQKILLLLIVLLLPLKYMNLSPTTGKVSCNIIQLQRYLIIQPCKSVILASGMKLSLCKKVLFTKGYLRSTKKLKIFTSPNWESTHQVTTHGGYGIPRFHFFLVLCKRNGICKSIIYLRSKTQQPWFS